MRTEPQPSHLEVTPGQTARVEIDVTNTTDLIDGVTAIVDGLHPDWVRLERPLLSLFPAETGSLALLFDIPAGCQAGNYLIIVHIVSAVDATRESVYDFWLTVSQTPDMTLVVLPSVVTGGRRGMARAVVRNTGNCPLGVAVTVTEPTREVDYHIDWQPGPVPFNRETPFEITLRGRRPWFGEPVTRSLVVEARAGDLVKSANLTFKQRPRIPRGVITALTLASIVALWAFIFLFVIDRFRGGDPEKAVATTIHTGRDNIELALIRGTIDGNVRASTNNAGIPNVTVEAFRIVQFPRTPGEAPPDPANDTQLIASGSTDEDGRYSLRTLIPGKYLVRFSAPGYGAIWYPGDLGSGLPPLSVDPPDYDPEHKKDQAKASHADVPLTGVLGSVQVQIELPQGANPDLLTASIVPKDGLSSPLSPAAPTDSSVPPDDGAPVPPSTLVPTRLTGVDPPPGPKPCSLSSTGLVTCNQLPTPGEYVISVSGPGFDTQRIDVDLVGGDDTVVDTVHLAGEPGTISGFVIDQNGAPLVGVKVSISSGEYVARVYSRSPDGRFEVDDLPTPNNFVVDFSLPGYQGKTIALALDAGQINPIAEPQQLVAGVGSISGVVVDENGSRLPGVQITVSGELSSAQTTTLTDGDQGSFFLQDLAVPGVYSVAFELPGFQTETRLVTFDRAELQSLGRIEMSTSLGQIQGSVIDPTGAPVGNAEVELTDGRTSRNTTTSTSGAGTFGFADVAPGSYTVIVRSAKDPNDPNNVKMWVLQRDVKAGEIVRLDRVVLPLQALGTIQGVVTTPDGTRLPLVAVALVGEGRTSSTTTARDGAGVGSYRFSGLNVPGTFTLTFRLANHLTATRTITLGFENGNQIQAVNATLTPNPGPVTGSVQTTDKTPLPGADVTLTPTTGSPLSTTTDAQGTFRLTSVPAGFYMIGVHYANAEFAADIDGIPFVVPAGGGALESPILVELVSVPSTTLATPTTVPAP